MPNWLPFPAANLLSGYMSLVLPAHLPAGNTRK